MFKCRVQIEPIISGYAHAEGRTCSGKRLYYSATFKSLQLAQERCASNEECACISETNCENGYFHIYSGQPITHSSDCVWTKQGIRI